MELQLSVVIVNYNGLQFLKNCLDSLEEKLDAILYEIIILDNDSRDESCTFIKENYPEVKLIESKINYGFAKGNNQAVKYAKGKYLLLFNNDTILLNRIESALELLEQDKTIGVIGINMLNAKKKYIPASGIFPNYKNMFRFKNMFLMGYEFKAGKFSKDYYEVDWLGGSFLLLLRETYSRVGGFDEDYFMYVEDVDFCKRIEKLGLKRVFMSRLNYIHYVGFNTKKNPLIVKGYKIYLKKHKKGIEYLILISLLNLNSVVKKVKEKFFIKA
ncbi:glycosyltransferase family 2 protein [Flavobacterium tibetense]|jgi:GT2 family glycosyltransferase|uniref:Glycosyltransferase 2-like domain-containing protein n=1 Tax=Flavobacterium tibetense TaxID=2233533 RepID=A0A365P561_9FLAO|nr:glycosyltransferase family 2 protein [Flavobacterium tibetense]RBA29703.1 hypothetical protein DPN68_00285 [Flavobacterium tibetense]